MIATAEPQTETARDFTVTMPYTVFALAAKITHNPRSYRPTLECVCIDLSHGKAIAADGFQLATVPIDVVALRGTIAPHSYVLIHRDDFARVKKLTKHGACITLGITNFASDGAGVTANFICDDVLVPVTAQPGTYPDALQIIPDYDREEQAYARIRLSPDLLTDLAALAKADGGDGVELTVPCSPLRPVITTTDHDVTICTMPMTPRV